MTTLLVPLDRICDNPFQSRQGYTGIEELARKILDMKAALPATRGLIHPPNARLIVQGAPAGDDAIPPSDDNADWYVELAEGHRRLRAFRLLAAGDEASGLPGDADYGLMPVNLVGLGDQAMDDIAWDENLARKDLSPVEEAWALQRTLDTFHLTQSSLADRRRLGRSTVTNKLRLLLLPNDILDAVHAGKLSERHGMAYLPILDIPDADLELVAKSLQHTVNFMTGSYWPPNPKTLRKRLLEVGDLTADQVRLIVDTLKRRIEEARRRKWEQPTDTPRGQSGAAATRPATGTDAAPAQAPSKPPPNLTPIPSPPIQPPIQSGGAIPIPMQADRVLPDVVVSIRIPRNGGDPQLFTLSIAEDGSFPRMYRGNYEEMGDTLCQACADFFGSAGAGTIETSEQILLEMEAQP